MSRGIFITMEGGDGAGKSTQIKNIKEYFEEKGYDVVVTREPGGTSISEKLREILLDKENSEMEPVTEMLIYAAGRAQIVRELIVPAVEGGSVVICDRFVDSSIAYQAYGRELGDQVALVNSYATAGLEPDITFFMDIDPELGRTRIGTGRKAYDRLELEKMDFHRRVYEGYIRLWEENRDRIVRIDASQPVEAVSADIHAALDRFLEAAGLQTAVR